ncbi:MAG: hypothetical protein U0790_12775 [Isosphaeraceae bacterium]
MARANFRRRSFGSGRAAGGVHVPARAWALAGDLGLEAFGLVFQEAAAFQGSDLGGGVLDAALRQGDPRQADLGGREVGPEGRARHTDLAPRGSVGSSRRAFGRQGLGLVGMIRRASADEDPADHEGVLDLDGPARRRPRGSSDAELAGDLAAGSMSTLARMNFPEYSPASFSSTGPSIRQGCTRPPGIDHDGDRDCSTTVPPRRSGWSRR